MEFTIEFLIVIFLCFFQSVFGVGLLLFGTPTFMMIGHDFVTTLSIILPVSITISFLQIVYKNSLKKKQIVEFNLFCLPVLFIFLVISINSNFIDIKLCVSLLLIISSIITLKKNQIILRKKYFLRYRRLCLIFIGSIHGFTNMGGGFLSIFSSLINGENKFITRGYIAYGYFIMGVVQYITILIFGLNNPDFTRIYYLFLPLLIFLPSQKVFTNIDDLKFKEIVNYLAIIYGIITLTTILK